jgi:hypothetical protein
MDAAPQTPVDAGGGVPGADAAPGRADAGASGAADAGPQTSRADAGASPGPGGPGPAEKDAGRPPAADGPPPAAPVDRSEYHFEQDVQGWQDLRNHGTVVGTSTKRAFLGTSALEARIDVRTAGANQERIVGIPSRLAPPLPAGETVTFRVWFPADHGLAAVQPYLLDRRNDKDRWTGSWRAPAQLMAGGWNTIQVAVPPDLGQILELGVQFQIARPWSGEVYVDAVSW